MRIYIFCQQEDGSYVQSGEIDGTGEAISSVEYVELTGDENLEIAVSWQMSEDVHTLAAYEFSQGTTDELMEATYTSYQLMDLNEDGSDEILIVSLPAPETYTNGVAAADNLPHVDYYTYDSKTNTLVSNSSATCSETAQTLESMHTGYLGDGSPAFFLTCQQENGSYVNDIFTLSGEELKNITLTSSGVSTGTICTQEVPVTDIDGDGITEVPTIYMLQSGDDSGDSVETPWAVIWKSYDATGSSQEVCRTYYNATEGWYFTFPDSWNEGTVAVTETGSTAVGQRTTVFSVQTADSGETGTMMVYRLTGSNRETRADAEGRFRLAESSSIIYAGEISGNCGLTESEAISCFHLIETEW